MDMFYVQDFMYYCFLPLSLSHLFMRVLLELSPLTEFFYLASARKQGAIDCMSGSLTYKDVMNDGP